MPRITFTYVLVLGIIIAFGADIIYQNVKFRLEHLFTSEGLF